MINYVQMPAKYEMCLSKIAYFKLCFKAVSCCSKRSIRTKVSMHTGHTFADSPPGMIRFKTLYSLNRTLHRFTAPGKSEVTGTNGASGSTVSKLASTSLLTSDKVSSVTEQMMHDPATVWLSGSFPRVLRIPSKAA